MKESWLLILEKDSMEIYAVQNITQQSKYFYHPRLYNEKIYKLGEHDESIGLFKRRSIIVDGFEASDTVDDENVKHKEDFCPRIQVYHFNTLQTGKFKDDYSDYNIATTMKFYSSLQSERRNRFRFDFSFNRIMQF